MKKWRKRVVKEKSEGLGWEVFVVPNFQPSQAMLVVMLESFLMNIDVLFL
jgi:hypothetical protein